HHLIGPVRGLVLRRIRPVRDRADHGPAVHDRRGSVDHCDLTSPGLASITRSDFSPLRIGTFLGGSIGLVTFLTRSRSNPFSASASTWSAVTPSGSWKLRRNAP